MQPLLPTPEQIAELKAKYGELFILEVKIGPDDTATAYLKPADRNVLAYALQGVAQDKLVEPGEFILTSCFVAGDERLKIAGRAETKAQISAAIAAVALVKTLETTVKNA